MSEINITDFEVNNWQFCCSEDAKDLDVKNLTDECGTICGWTISTENVSTE